MNVRRKIKKALNPTPKDEQVHFNSMSLFHGHFKATYKGVKAIRCPFDYLMYQMIISEIKPDLIIEIGANEGGGALYLADLLLLQGKGELHSIDITNDAYENVKDHPKIKFFPTGWETYDLSQAANYKTVMVIEDAAHTYECTKGVLDKFAGVVTKNSYLVVEDGIVDELDMTKLFNGGPLKAIREFLPKHDEYIVDRKWCDMFGKNATFNVNGYLKKIK